MRLGRLAALGALWAALTGFGDTAWFAAREGAEKYAAGDFAGALSAYLEAQQSEPDDRAIDYNLGGAYFKTGKFDDAIKAYERAMAAEEPSLRGRAAFNQGAALLGKGEAAMNAGDAATARGALEQSAERYREIVRHDRANKDARRNLEVALLRLRQLAALPPQDKKEDQHSGDQGKQGQQKNQPDASPEPQKKQDDQPREADAKGEEKGGGKERRPVPGEMTKEEARMILNAIERDEAGVKRGAREKMMGAREENVEKDW